MTDNQEAVQNKRSSARCTLLEYAAINVGDASLMLRSVVVDISLGGLQVRSHEEFAVGLVCSLNIGRLHSTPLEIDAEVRYCRPIEGTSLYATGFRVLPRTEEQKAEWGRFVHSAFVERSDSLTA